MHFTLGTYRSNELWGGALAVPTRFALRLFGRHAADHDTLGRCADTPAGAPVHGSQSAHAIAQLTRAQLQPSALRLPARRESIGPLADSASTRGAVESVVRLTLIVPRLVRPCSTLYSISASYLQSWKSSFRERPPAALMRSEGWPRSQRNDAPKTETGLRGNLFLRPGLQALPTPALARRVACPAVVHRRQNSLGNFDESRAPSRRYLSRPDSSRRRTLD